MRKIVLLLLVTVCVCILLFSRKSTNTHKKLVRSARLPMKNLTYGDTIRLIAFYADCGEFGGHQERIDIFHPEPDTIYYPAPRNIKPVAVLMLDSTNCETTHVNHPLYQAAQAKLSVEQQLLVEKYMHDLLTYGQQEFPLVNASNGFRAKFYSHSMGTVMTDISVSDTRFGFNGFRLLRQQLFNSRNK